MNADGTDAHEILANERTGSEGGLQWSPGGDRLAIGLGGAIYTFAPDGSDFTKVITGGHSPNWSPDGSQIAYTIQCGSLRGVGQSGSQPQQVTGVTWYSREDAAERVGGRAFVPRRLADLGLPATEEPDRFSPGDLRP
jgi:Tol biopolymer transport system component